MDASSSKMPVQTSLFQVYLRLRPALQNQIPNSEPWLVVEPPSPPTTPIEESPKASTPTHITLQPPNDSRKRAVEKFGFTKVFQEEATQLDIFESTGTAQLVRNVLNGGKDGLVATLGVTGSGKVANETCFLLTADESRLTPSLDLVRNAA
jgi:Kinesin motor domain